MATLTIFLHGIGSSSDTWTKFVDVFKSDKDTSTIEEYIPNSTNLNDDTHYYYLYDYKTEILGSGKIVSKIKESFSGTKVHGNIAIDNHVNSLKSFIEFNSQEFSLINIVAHSLGGILTMKLLLEFKRKTEIINKLETVLLYGVPLKGSDEPNELKKYLGKNIPTKVLQELISDSVTITSLNQNISQENCYLKRSFKIIYIKGDSDNRIIEVEDTYIEKIGTMENVQGGHSEIINPKNINDQSFIYFKRFIFEHSKEKLAQAKRQKKIINKVNNVSFTSDFSDFLHSADVLVSAHPDKERVTLDDIYVYPRLENYYDINISKKRISSKKIINKYKPSKILIAGEGQSGKTSLCKQYIQGLRKQGFIPIYLSDEKNPYEGRIEHRLTNAFKDQYAGCLFDEVPLERIIPILDNFHIAKKKERHISDLTKYPSTILIVDDLFSLNLSQDSQLSKYNHYKIKEFSPTLRSEIIKKWMELSDNGISSNDKYESLDAKSELVETSLGKVIGNGIMPAYPFFILTIISTFETFDKPLEQEITSQGYCYQSLIYLYLRKQNVKNDDIDTYINFLTEFAYFFYKEKKKEISKDEFNIFLETYLEQYNLPIKKEVLLKKLNKIQIISLDSFSNYSFCYPYLYYFFVAKYLADPSNKRKNEIIEDLIKSLHKNENAYILTFISHHSKDDYVLDELISSSNDLYASYSPSTLCTKELAFFDDKINELLEAVLPNGNSSPEQERVRSLKAQDKIEENNDADDTDDEVGKNEDYLNLRKSIKTVEVMGHIIKNRAGSLKKEKLESIFLNAMNINLRIIREFIQIIEKEENQEEILDFFKARFKGILKDNGDSKLSKEESDKIIVKLFWNINFFIISTILDKVIHSLGSDKLINIVNDVCDKEGTPATYLVKHGILMWYKKNIQIDNIVKRVEKNDFSSTSKRILDFMVANHCYLHNIKTKDLQKIENKLGIVTGKLNSPFVLMKS